MFQRINAVILVLLSTITIYCQSENCDVINTSFQDGEELTFKVFYNWFVVFADVGEATMKVEKDNIYNKEAYHFYADGKSNSWWDNFFEVRDRYEAWVDPHTLRPYLFQRNIKEGTFKQHVSYVFNPEDTTAYSKYKVNNDKLKQDTLKITPCTYDVMSSLLYARNIDYSRLIKDEKIPVTVLLDLELYDLFFRYKGIETIKVKGLGEFECIRFTVMLVEGTLFHEGEDMSIWVTNDKNHIPVYIETPILIGNIRARLTSYKGLRHPLDSKVDD